MGTTSHWRNSVARTQFNLAVAVAGAMAAAELMTGRSCGYAPVEARTSILLSAFYAAALVFWQGKVARLVGFVAKVALSHAAGFKDSIATFTGQVRYSGFPPSRSGGARSGPKSFSPRHQLLAWRLDSSPVRWLDPKAERPLRWVVNKHVSFMFEIPHGHDPQPLLRRVQTMGSTLRESAAWKRSV